MKYYTIQQGCIYTADKEQALTRFYDGVKELPEDFELGKYIIEECKLVPNPDYEEEQKAMKLAAKISEIKEKLADLDSRRIRAICENEIKDEETGESWLDYYNKQVIDLRKELTEISS